VASPYSDGIDDNSRECRQGQWCAGAVIVYAEGGEQIRRGAPTYQAFCIADRGKVAVALDAMPRDYAALGAELGRPGHGTAAVRSPFGPRIPLALGTEALMRAMTESLASWHDRVAGVCSLTELPDRDEEGRRIARDGWLLDRAVRILSPSGEESRLNALLALPPEPMRRAETHRLVQMLGDDAPDGTVRSGYASLRPELDGAAAGLEILRFHHMARAVLGETRERPVELLGVPCRWEDCDMRALRRADLPDGYEPGGEAPWSVCAACGDVMTEAEYQAWVKRYARWAQQRAGGAS